MSNDQPMADTDSFWGKPISIYTRAQALADGVLVDLTQTSKLYGFKIPLACTEAVWRTLEWNEQIEARKLDASGQTTEGRVHDVLTLARMAANGAAQAGTSIAEFDVLIVPAEGNGIAARLERLRLVVSGGDAGEPVLTLMFLGED